MPPPPDRTIDRLAAALDVSPQYFLEYRVRRVAEALEADPAVATSLYLAYTLPPRRRRAVLRRVVEVVAAETASGPD